MTCFLNDYTVLYTAIPFLFFLGKFSPVQREVYNAVLRVQEKCIDLCGNFLSLERIFLEMLKYIGEELKTLGIVPRGIHGAELQRVGFFVFWLVTDIHIIIFDLMSL